VRRAFDRAAAPAAPEHGQPRPPFYASTSTSHFNWTLEASRLGRSPTLQHPQNREREGRASASAVVLHFNFALQQDAGGVPVEAGLNPVGPNSKRQYPNSKSEREGGPSRPPRQRRAAPVGAEPNPPAPTRLRTGRADLRVRLLCFNFNFALQLDAGGVPVEAELNPPANHNASDYREGGPPDLPRVSGGTAGRARRRQIPQSPAETPRPPRQTVAQTPARCRG
jgi:hypothetical protein